MSHRTWLETALFPVFFWSLGVVIAYADSVEHHGFRVNPEGTYAECLSCHDGILAPQVSTCLGTICTFQDSHPIDRYYPPPNRMREFAPAATAEMAGIKFIGRKIDCISCHNLTATDHYHLRVSDWRSKLCLACHLK